MQAPQQDNSLCGYSKNKRRCGGKKMKKATIIVGKDEKTEDYSLLIGKNYTSLSYNFSRNDYENFLNNVCTEFARIISGNQSNLELEIVNGFKLIKLDEQEDLIKTEMINAEMFSTKKLNELCSKRNSDYFTADMN